MKFSLAPAIIILFASLPSLRSDAQTSLDADTALRLDYIFNGRSEAQPQIALAKTLRQPGSKVNPTGNAVPLRGNGQVLVTNFATGDTLYRQSFSSLFQEWLETGDTVVRAFQHPVLIPNTRQKVNVTIQLFNNRHQTIATHSSTLNPDDILIRTIEPQTNAKYIHKGSWPGTKIGVAILAEGYTTEQLDTFLIHAQRATDAILRHEPFNELSDRFDFIAVPIPSQHRGVSVPKNRNWVKTPFGSHFSTFYSDRYLTTPNLFDVHDAIAGLPVQHIIILANTDTYGGGGIYNSYTLTAAGNKQFEPVVVHEFGHSFAGLADEYFYEQDVMNDTYPLDVEPWEQNITTLVDFNPKWADMLPPNYKTIDHNSPLNSLNAGGKGGKNNAPEALDNKTIGVFEGAGYSTFGLYRPADVCRMRTNSCDGFCPVCQRAIKRIILYLAPEK